MLYRILPLVTVGDDSDSVKLTIGVEEPEQGGSYERGVAARAWREYIGGDGQLPGLSGDIACGCVESAQSKP
jgi:hypothetical protein